MPAQPARKNYISMLADMDVDDLSVRRALVEMQRALKDGGSTAEIAALHTAMGMAYLRLGDGDKAVKHHSNAIRFEPSNPIHLTNFAVSMERLHRWGEALDLILRALETAPDNPVTLSNAAEILNVIGQHEDAVVLIARAAALLRSDVHEHIMVARVLAVLGQDEAAVEITARAAHLSCGVQLQGRTAIEVLRLVPEFTQAAMKMAELRGAIFRADRLHPLVSVGSWNAPVRNLSEVDNSSFTDAEFAASLPLRQRANATVLTDEQG